MDSKELGLSYSFLLYQNIGHTTLNTAVKLNNEELPKPLNKHIEN
jgi:hypothetical protein